MIMTAQQQDELYQVIMSILSEDNDIFYLETRDRWRETIYNSNNDLYPVFQHLDRFNVRKALIAMINKYPDYLKEWSSLAIDLSLLHMSFFDMILCGESKELIKQMRDLINELHTLIVENNFLPNVSDRVAV